MTKESLLLDIYPDVCTTDYCSVCFRTSNERRLINGKNLAKFKFFRQANGLEIRGDVEKYCSQKVCYMCDAQALAANKFCLAVNLSQHIHNLFHKMKRQPSFASEVIDHLTNTTNRSELIHNHRNIEDLEKKLEELRRNTTLLQTETLLLNNPGDECKQESPSTTAGRESLRDLLTFETHSGIDEALFHLDASEINNKQIIIEDDDTIKEEPPDQNVFIIPDALPSAPKQPDRQTGKTAGYLLHPIVVKNGTITIPSLDKNISITDNNLIVSGLANNTNNKYVVTPLTHITTKTPTNSNKNTPNLSFIQNTNSLAKNIVSLVKNPIAGQKKQNFLQNKSNLHHSPVTLEQNSLNFSQNTPNLRPNTITSTQINQHNIISYVVENTVNLPAQPPMPTAAKKMLPVKPTASPVKRPDSDIDSNTNCQNIQPIRKPDGKIDWEDKIPMDVISFVSPTDPTTMAAKRQKVTSEPCPSGYVTGPDLRHGHGHAGDAMDKCIITDVKSVREHDVIDLC